MARDARDGSGCSRWLGMARGDVSAKPSTGRAAKNSETALLRTVLTTDLGCVIKNSGQNRGPQAGGE
eukprot:2075860-Prymnesium_polylepis.1